MASLESATLFKEGRIVLHVKNADIRPRPIQIRLITPLELTASPETISETLSAQENKSFTFSIHNISGLPGSAYAANAIIEYDTEGKHTTSLAPARIFITNETSFLKQTNTTWWLLGFSLLIGLIGGRVYLKNRTPKQETK